MENQRLNSIDEAIAEIASGRMIIVVDDAQRENEGDLLMAAELCTHEQMNFFVKEARGLVCAPIDTKQARRLGLDLMVEHNTDPHGTAFTVSVDALKDSTTGISAHERAATVNLLADVHAKPEDFRRPGHIFPLVAREGGVLKRAGHTEAAVDLARLAGLRPAGVICEIMNDDGSMARLPDLMRFAQKHQLKIISVADLIRYRLTREHLVTREAEVNLPTEFGDFRVIAYKFARDTNPETVHLALIKGDISGMEDVLVRVHSECLTGDLLGSLRCDCGPQLHKALEMIEKEGRGVLLYIRQEGRGIGLVAKLKAYELQDKGMDTVEANIALGFAPDLRDYGVGAQILADLGLHRFRLLTNNPGKIVGLEGYGLEVAERVPLEIESNPHNERYLKTKCSKMGHVLHLH